MNAIPTIFGTGECCCTSQVEHGLHGLVNLIPGILSLPPRHDEIVRVTVGDGGFVFGAREEDFWRSMRLTLVYAVVTVPLGLFGALAVLCCSIRRCAA